MGEQGRRRDGRRRTGKRRCERESAFGQVEGAGWCPGRSEGRRRDGEQWICGEEGWLIHVRGWRLRGDAGTGAADGPWRSEGLCSFCWRMSEARLGADGQRAVAFDLIIGLPNSWGCRGDCADWCHCCQGSHSHPCRHPHRRSRGPGRPPAHQGKRVDSFTAPASSFRWAVAQLLSFPFPFGFWSNSASSFAPVQPRSLQYPPLQCLLHHQTHPLPVLPLSRWFLSTSLLETPRSAFPLTVWLIWLQDHLLLVELLPTVADYLSLFYFDLLSPFFQVVFPSYVGLDSFEICLRMPSLEISWPVNLESSWRWLSLAPKLVEAGALALSALTNVFLLVKTEVLLHLDQFTWTEKSKLCSPTSLIESRHLHSLRFDRASSAQSTPVDSLAGLMDSILRAFALAASATAFVCLVGDHHSSPLPRFRKLTMLEHAEEILGCLSMSLAVEKGNPLEYWTSFYDVGGLYLGVLLESIRATEPATE